MADADCPYASRGGLKLEHALREFAIDPTGLVCADLGASTGGFTDCLLKHGASKVYAVDTAYGELAWSLRNDPRVIVMERSNALHTDPPADIARCSEGSGGQAKGADLVVMDLGWTKQRFAIPAALKWLSPNGRIITLVKPHYEGREETRGARTPDVVLTEQDAELITQRVAAQMPEWGVRVLGITKSPVLGGAVGRKKSKGSGNAEWLVLAAPLFRAV